MDWKKMYKNSPAQGFEPQSDWLRALDSPSSSVLPLNYTGFKKSSLII